MWMLRGRDGTRIPGRPRVPVVAAAALLVSACGGWPQSDAPPVGMETEESLSATEEEGATDEGESLPDTEESPPKPPSTEETEAPDDTEETEAPEDTEETESPGSTEETEGSDGSTDPESKKSKSRGFGYWLSLLIPSAATGPPTVEAYELLQQNRCSELLEGVDSDRLPLGQSETLYRGAAAACLAAFHGRSDLWLQAIEAAQDGAPVGGGCLDQAVAEMLELLVDEHRKDPSAQFEVTTGGRSTIALRCPSIGELEAKPGEDGTSIRIRGNFLDDPQLEVHLFSGSADTRLVANDVVRDGDDLVVGDVPAGVRSVCVALHTVPDWYADAMIVGLPVAADGSGDDSTEDLEGPSSCPPGFDG
jgi:hypothetical protein